MAEETNPFAELLGRLAQVPMRAIKLPFQLVGEALGTPAARNQDLAGELQRQLGAQVTGQQTPFSGGRQIANALSLGLIPNNPSAQVNPAGLNADQQGRFGQLTPLQQRLLQARNPADFAGLIGDASLFEERAPIKKDPLINVTPGARVFDPNSREEAFSNPVQGKPIIVPKDAAVLLPGADGLSSKNEPTPDRFTTLAPNAMLIDNETKETVAVNRTLEKLSEGQVLVDPVTKMEIFFNPKTPTPENVSQRAAELSGKRFTNESKLRGEFYGITQIDRKRADQWKGLSGVFALDKESRLPADVLFGLGETIPGFKGKDANGLRDVAMIFSFLKILDPESTVREGEKDFIASARALFGHVAEITIENALQGELLTDEQRAEMINAMADIFREKFTGYDQAISETRKIALRNGLDPLSSAPDTLAPLRKAFIGHEFPVADNEVIDLVDAALGGNPTPEELRAGIANAGFFMPKAKKPER